MRDNVQDFSQQKKVLCLNEKDGKLSETAERELLQVSNNVQQKLWKTLWLAASHQWAIGKDSQIVEESTENRKVEDKGTYSIEQMQLDREHVDAESNSKGGNDHLLILAQSAELMLESDSLDGVYRNDQNQEGFDITPGDQDSSGSMNHAADLKSPGKQVEVTSVVDCVRSEEIGFQGSRTPRLSQIRRQARSQCNLLLQERLGESMVEHMQGRRIRLTQIRHQARSKNHSQLQEKIQKHSCGDSQGTVVRLSEFRRQARSRSNSLVQEVIEDHMLWHLDHQTSKDDHRQRIIADLFGEEDGSRAVADYHRSEVDSMHDSNVNGRVDQSVPVSIEVQDKMIPEKGRMRLSQLRREARLGNASTLRGGQIIVDLRNVSSCPKFQVLQGLYWLNRRCFGVVCL
ncbi:uncharacterized protein LOC8281807 isoform X2 [Ricinus communis]|uniref:uncharacterized protein LOC8281807 isoform X2 n=1 Tax=Ricinus communis TaxID=3988 RepID=UPI00201A4D65|nr:uncharacterized protein LOC8281807 isoform X2 [Ricinus communis]